MTNFYDILGVNKNADILEIKKKYKSLAKQYHPDKNPDPDAIEKFKNITVAYDTLKDSNKREEYDRKIRFGNSGGGFNFKYEESSSNRQSHQNDFNDIFNEILKQRMRRERDSTQRKKEREQAEDINDILRRTTGGWKTTAENVNSKKFNFDPDFLNREPNDPIYQYENNKKNSDKENSIKTISFTLTLKECLEGTVKSFKQKGKEKETSVKIPARVYPGLVLNVNQLNIKIEIKAKFRKWKFIDGDVYINLSLGKIKDGFIEIETIIGEKLKIKTPKQEDLVVGKKIRLSKKGWLNQKDERSDMFIVFIE